jgi:hypothetical protein
MEYAVRKTASRCLLLFVVAALPASAADPGNEQSVDAQKPASAGPQRPPTPLAIVGFRADEQLDERDAWVPLAVE